MKTNEFIKRVEELGYEVRTNNWSVFLTKNGHYYMRVNLKREFVVETYSEIDRIKYDDRIEMYEIAVEYSKTPISEREEEKKYYIRLKAPKGLNIDHDYPTHVLNLNVENNYWFYDTTVGDEYIKTMFTEKDLKELGYKLSDFEYCEVGTDEWKEDKQ